VTVRQVAQQLGISPSLVYALCHDGVLPHTRFGRPGKRGTIRIEEAAVEAYRLTCKGAGQPAAAPPGLKHIALS
jgi:excisionase family DNA binding protein